MHVRAGSLCTTAHAERQLDTKFRNGRAEGGGLCERLFDQMSYLTRTNGSASGYCMGLGNASNDGRCHLGGGSGLGRRGQSKPSRPRTDLYHHAGSRLGGGISAAIEVDGGPDR